MLARIHDLLEIGAEPFLRVHSPMPDWVAENLRETPFVVVRRGPVPAGQGLAVGVRGAQRSERWAAVCRPELVKRILTPPQLLGHAASALRADALPALRALSVLRERWKSLALPWGPGGSVGFELASGRPTVSPHSDLDVVIHAEARMTAVEAAHLLDSAQGLAAAVDIRIETPCCGFSLAEFAGRSPAPILLRFASHVALGTDPWSSA